MWPRIAILVRPLICTYWTKSLYSLGRNLVSASGGSYRWLSASKIGNGTSSRCDNWPMESSFAFCENTILKGRLIATLQGRGSALGDDLEGGAGRFPRLVDPVTVGRSGDRESAVVMGHGGIAPATLRVHPGETTQILDPHGFGGHRFLAVIDDNLGAGNIAANSDRPDPLHLGAVDDLKFRIVPVDGHGRRVGRLSLRPRSTCPQAGDGGRGGGRRCDSVPHWVTSILRAETTGPAAMMLFSVKENANIGRSNGAWWTWNSMTGWQCSPSIVRTRAMPSH